VNEVARSEIGHTLLCCAVLFDLDNLIIIADYYSLGLWHVFICLSALD